MRSRIARRAARLLTVPAAMLLGAGTASAESVQTTLAASSFSSSIVPITAVSLGVGGLLLGIVRRKKNVTVDPANERREPEMVGSGTQV